MSETLLTVQSTSLGIEPFLQQHGTIFRAFRGHDSGCVSYGVEATDGSRWFVKNAQEPGAAGELRRVQRLHESVQHPALPRLHNSFETATGLAHVYDWVAGEVLYDYVAFRANGRRHGAASAFVRFQSLSADRILAALDSIYDLHQLLAERGYIAVDFYDGCVLYDFDTSATHVCDLDHYREGPFMLDADRLPGSTRFMAQEEFVRGSTIDQTTNVFTLGRAAAEFLGGGQASHETWRASPGLLNVIHRAIQPDRAQRYPSVADFVDAWQAERNS